MVNASLGWLPWGLPGDATSASPRTGQAALRTHPASQPSQRSRRSSLLLLPHTSQKVGSSSSSPALALSTGI